MTKIAILPNAAGTGTFSIEAPNSYSNRTLVLPYAAGEIYGQGNILGTVSQSGGVPTGAIIENGSNANGEFVKYADGTMICTGVDSFSSEIDDAVGDWFRSPSRQVIMPATFVGDYAINYSSNGNGAFTYFLIGHTGSSRDYRLYRSTAVTSSESFEIVWSAIGRWF